MVKEHAVMLDNTFETMNSSEYTKYVFVERSVFNSTKTSDWKRVSRKNFDTHVLRLFEHKPTGKRAYAILSIGEETVGERLQIWEAGETLFGLHEEEDVIVATVVSRDYYEQHKCLPDWHITETISALYNIPNLDEVTENMFVFEDMNRDELKTYLKERGLVYDKNLNSETDKGDELDANDFL
jgi:hypothetical protein